MLLFKLIQGRCFNHERHILITPTSLAPLVSKYFLGLQGSIVTIVRVPDWVYYSTTSQVFFQYHGRQSILTLQMNSFIYEVIILIFYTVELNTD